MERWSRPVPAPSVEILRGYLHQPLTENEKVPLSQEFFNMLYRAYSSGPPGNALSAEKLLSLFRVSEDEEASRVFPLFWNALDRAIPRHGTEDSFHEAWDQNIGSILGSILPSTIRIRNSNRNTSTALKRPDYGLLVKNHCVFRGEEKGSDSAGNPNDELVNKIERWTYDPLPYILGLLWILL